MELVEPTSGKYRTVLAAAAAARLQTHPDHAGNHESIERRKLLKALGANLVLTEVLERDEKALGL